MRDSYSPPAAPSAAPSEACMSRLSAGISPARGHGQSRLRSATGNEAAAPSLLRRLSDQGQQQQSAQGLQQPPQPPHPLQRSARPNAVSRASRRRSQTQDQALHEDYHLVQHALERILSGNNPQGDAALQERLLKALSASKHAAVRAAFNAQVCVCVCGEGGG